MNIVVMIVSNVPPMPARRDPIRTSNMISAVRNRMLCSFLAAVDRIVAPAPVLVGEPSRYAGSRGRDTIT